jgi:hypothetical protein
VAVDVRGAEHRAIGPVVIDLVDVLDADPAAGREDEQCYRRRVRYPAIAIAVLAAAIPSRADADGPAVAAPGGPDDIVGRDVVLPRDGGEAAAALELNLTVRYELEPASVAPDVWYGATDKLTVGIVHSARALGVLRTGGGLCVRDSAHGCPRAYDNVGVDARYALRRGWLAIAARARFAATSFDPFKPSIRPGALIRLHRGRFAIVADPHLQLGLTNRDLGNRDWLRIPLWFAIQPARRIALAVRMGLDGELATFGDTFALPFGLDVTVRISRRIELAALLALPSIGGPQNNPTSRLAWLSVTGRWP